MIEIEFFKDIKDQKAKLIGPFTGRQLICAVLGAGGSIGTFLAAKSIVGNITVSMLIALIIAVPAALFGAVEPYGMTFENFLKSVWENYLKPPKKIYYKTQNIYEDFERELIAEEEKEKLQNANNKKSSDKKSNKNNKKG